MPVGQAPPAAAAVDEEDLQTSDFQEGLFEARLVERLGLGGQESLARQQRGQ